jgi:tRNA nucleotidyltransferase/poly(A) polymerase
MTQFTSHPHWKAVLRVAKTLHAKGYDAYLAGGCVRDALLNVEPHDFDVATNARPEVVEQLFPGAITVGRQFGVIKVPFPQFQVEITTFRRDIAYRDGRRPTDVVYCTPEEDAERRDFTVNALFYDIRTNKILDFVNGRTDLKKKIIRAVGDPRLRFDEDKLRILRAVRFEAQLGFEIESQTRLALAELAPQVRMVSPERIREEMTKLLRSRQRVRALRSMADLSLLSELFPQLQQTLSLHPEQFSLPPQTLFAAKRSLWEQTLDTLGFADLENAPDDVLWTLFYLNWAKSMWLVLDFGHLQRGEWHSSQLVARLEEEISWLKFSNHQARTMVQALAHFPEVALRAEWPLHHFKKTFAHPWAEVLLLSYAADCRVVRSSLQSANWYQQQVRQRLGAKRALPAAFLTGADLKAAGLTPGRHFGQILDLAFDQQLDGRLKTRANALQWLKKKVSQWK